MQAYQNGIDGAFDLLFKRHSSRVYGFLMNHLKNRAQADDVFQATFLKLHQARRHYTTGCIQKNCSRSYSLCRFADDLRRSDGH